MNRSPRQKTQPKKFTPTQSILSSPENYLLRFEDNGELIVAKRSSIRSINEDKVVVGIGKKRRTGIIEAKGSYSQCNAMYEQLTVDNDSATIEQEGFGLNTQDHMNESEEDGSSIDDSDQAQTQIHSPLTQKRKLSSLTMDENEEEPDANAFVSQQNLTANKKRRRLFDDSQRTKISLKQTKNTKTILSSEPHVLYQTMDEMYYTIFDKFEKKLEGFTKKFERLIPRSVDPNLDSYREKEEVFQTTVMYGDKDLLIFRGRDIYDFARQILRVLFTLEELNTCILPPGRSYLARPSLDIDRFNKFHDAVRVKYRISILHYDSCYSKLIKPRMADFLVDERKRQAKALRQQSTTAEETYNNNNQ